MGLGIALERGGPLVATSGPPPTEACGPACGSTVPTATTLRRVACGPGKTRGLLCEKQVDTTQGVTGSSASTASPLDRFLPGRCITMDIAADGSVWVLADKDKGRDLYVITPEAVAAAE